MDASGVTSKPPITPYEATVGLYKELSKYNEDICIEQIRYWIENGAQLKGYECKQGIPLLYALTRNMDVPIIRLLAEHTGNILDYKCYVIDSIIRDKSDEFSFVFKDDICDISGCSHYTTSENMNFHKYYVKVQSVYNIILENYNEATHIVAYDRHLFEHMYMHGYIEHGDLQFQYKDISAPRTETKWVKDIRAICEIVGIDYNSLENGKPEFAPNLRDYKNTVNMMRHNIYNPYYLFYDYYVDYESDTESDTESYESDDSHTTDIPKHWKNTIHSTRALAKPKCTK
jgi:hypothetical protein